ncbi:sensor histidine kinase [Camelliibacillus cellulosilyticus]|uniref:histidine kinase n=1 Tax=Camelliibacillus cellulosilyticus TaxID=2174486 RepID=A0ABV9GPY2_9BACL
MRKRIVVKLFLLTTALCMLILVAIFIGQTLFFKQFYANRKVDGLKTNLQTFKKAYLRHEEDNLSAQKLEQDFYREHGAWVTVLDQHGNLLNSNAFYLQVKLDRSKDRVFSQRTVTVPLNYLVNGDDMKRSPFSEKTRVGIYGVQSGETLVPYFIGELGTFFPTPIQGTIGALLPAELDKERGKSYWENQILEKKVGAFLHDSKSSRERRSSSPIKMVSGTVKKVQMIDSNQSADLVYTSQVFMDRIKAFQADLLLNKKNQKNDTFKVIDYELNDVKYKFFVDPLKDKDGGTRYIVSLASLQPVDEAVQMVKDYYIYIVAFVLFLTLLAAFYYSRKIAGPLLRINKTTQKMANLDFSEKLPMTSKDEIGALSKNINMLSDTLHTYIERLHQDIEKEKQLEDTRKAFISGVSHELKTPLSIMKSCMSILKDGVASHKKDYYFEAMAKEVDKMNVLIVDMLELAKYESGTYKMKMDVFYIDKIIEPICDRLGPEFAKKQLMMRTNLKAIEVVGNQHRIAQVVTNFITNAIRYTPEKEAIIISTIEEKDQVKICVENKGVHISPDQMDKVWDRFYRGDDSRNRSDGGTGLGLAISKNILELHGAPYGVTNTLDGVLFYFYLRLSK